MTPQTALIKTTPQSLQKIGNALAITEKILQDDNPLGLPDLIPYRKGDKWGFCNRKKEIVIDCEYDWVMPFREGLASIRLEGLYGFINEFIYEIHPKMVNYQSDRVSYAKLQFIETFDADEVMQRFGSLKSEHFKELLTKLNQSVFSFGLNP